MELEEYNNFYHVDISPQIDNKWDEDTVLGIVKDSRKYSIKIRRIHKEKLKKRFIDKGESRSIKKHNKKVVALIYSYLLYKALIEFDDANPLLLCRDVRPESLVIHYLTKISNFFGNKKLINGRKINFRKRENKNEEKLPKSLAGKYTRKVYQGKYQPNKTLNDKEIEDLEELISKIL